MLWHDDVQGNLDITVTAATEKQLIKYLIETKIQARINIDANHIFIY
ncbi:hypothetical protein [Lactiplantibacillus paraplantarum]|nr:hypothetical protein [Lactiplantibacillus paraplantarum]WEE37173.1 hypothetical protein PWO93_06210 [Lactiplantibacillus paraplantarum]